MKRPFVRPRRAAALSASAAPARADFASCVGSIEATPRTPGISPHARRRLQRLEPDPKVLDLQHSSPSSRRRCGTIVDGLVDEDRSRRRQGRHGAGARALARAEATIRRAPHHAGGDLGVESISARRWASARSSQSLTTLASWALAPIIPLRTDGDAQDHRPWRRAGRKAQRLIGRARSADQFMPSTLAPGGRRRRRRAARHCRSAPTRSLRPRTISPNPATARLSWGFEVRLPETIRGRPAQGANNPCPFWARRTA